MAVAGIQEVLVANDATKPVSTQTVSDVWAYLVQANPPSFANGSDYQTWLNGFGTQGWELVQINLIASYVDPNTHISSSVPTHAFKRRVS